MLSGGARVCFWRRRGSYILLVGDDFFGEEEVNQIVESNVPNFSSVGPRRSHQGLADHFASEFCQLDVVLLVAVTFRAKLLGKILAGTSDQTISFDELVTLLRYLGFQGRIAGSHHIFSRVGVAEILNLQPRRDGTAKPYQVKQVRQLITRYRLIGENDAI